MRVQLELRGSSDRAVASGSLRRPKVKKGRKQREGTIHESCEEESPSILYEEKDRGRLTDFRLTGPYPKERGALEHPFPANMTAQLASPLHSPGVSPLPAPGIPPLPSLEYEYNVNKPLILSSSKQSNSAEL